MTPATIARLVRASHRYVRAVWVWRTPAGLVRVTLAPATPCTLVAQVCGDELIWS